MRYTTIILFFAILIFGLNKNGSAQNDVPIHPTIIKTGIFYGETPPLRDLPAMTPQEFKQMARKLKNNKENNESLEKRSYPYAATALPRGADQVWQKMMGGSGSTKAPLVNFSGQDSPYYPPDCNGAAGQNHYMQTINTVYAIYNKTGTLVAGPTAMNLLFSGVTGSNYNDGDPLVLYDDQAGRWLAVEFSISGSNDYMLIAVSTTSDPTGTWYKYSFDVADMPDYEKFGIWQDGYYMGDNNSSGNDIYVFQRSVMLAGGASPQMVGFKNSWRPTTVDGFMCVPPVDNDGAFAPAGSPGLFITINDDAIGGGSDQLWIYELAVNWTTPASSTFTRSQQLAVPAFDSNFGTSWDNIVQPNTQKLDAIPMVIMNVPQYRNFGSYQTIVCCHTVDVDATNHAGVRWYELRRTTGNPWTVRQSGTYAPDANNRWMGSVMLNGSGQIGLGYSVSSSTVYPSIRYCGQSAGAYASASGTMDITEDVIQTGAYAQSSYNRWGDYSLMSVDPTDDKTFWFTSEYLGSGGTRKTKIASFKFGNSPSVATLAATSVTGTTATLNGTINPNGLATTYYFEWGTTTSYGTTTTVISAGSGTTSIAVNANLSGLTGGQTYHFRLVGVNSDGTTSGNDMTFTPGAATVTTTAATSITMSDAATGGNVTSDGGSSITARGVCWGTTANPAVSGSHTTDGSGTGSFTSTLTGLSSNTTYHIRAYATNSAGAYYGDDLTFTTLCGIVTTFPWSEGFENGGVIPNCWSQEQVNSSGLNWVFITGSGNSHPAAAHGGTYNACLKDATSADNKTKLITPTLNLAEVTSPQLKFWHTQAYWTPDQDLLTVFYKTSAGGTWTLLATYTASITVWTQETISLPGATNDYYIAFEGNAKYGYGVCLDDVQVSGSCTTTVPVSISIAASANPTCQGTSVTFTATPTNGGTTPVYQWKVNGINAGSNNTVFAYVPVLADLVSCILTSNATCVTGNPATSNVITMTVTPTLAVGSIGTSQTICANTVPVQLSGAPPLNGTLPTYQWQSSLNNSTFSNISGATILNYQPGSLPVTTYYRQLQNATGTCGGPLPTNTLTMTVNPILPVSISISASANPVCAGTLVTFTSTATNSGTNTLYQWKVNGTGVTGATNATYSYSSVNDDVIACVLTSGETCTSGNPATSNMLTMTVNPLLPVSISIAASANPVCAGTPVTYTATPLNGGAVPAYQWKVNGTNVPGATNATYQYIPANGNTLTCVLISGEACSTGNPAVSNAVTMMVNPMLPVSVSISASANPVCAGTMVTYTARPVNGGTNPSYQWQVNGTEVPGEPDAAFTYFPADGDKITCIMTSGETCTIGNPAASNTETMTVIPLLPMTISISTVANPVCDATLVAFNATVSNGGTDPLYQWKVNGGNVAGETDSMFFYFPADHDVVTCMATSREPCMHDKPATSNPLTMTVSPLLPVSISIIGSANPVCDGILVTFSASPVNGGNNPSYQWQVNGTDATGATGAAWSYPPADGDMIVCILTSSETCTSGNPATSNTEAMTVNPLLPVNVSIAASANPVDKGTSVTFTATPVNGGTSPVYQWKVNGSNAGTNSNLYTYVPVDGDVGSCILTSDELCTSSNPANSNNIIMVVNAVPQTADLQNITVSDTSCFDAIQTISVAGNGTSFSVVNGGYATMIAGQKILYYPGTTVEPGGYLIGYIAPDGPYCEPQRSPAIVAGSRDKSMEREQTFFRLYPNPTDGKFVLTVNIIDQAEKATVVIYNMNGEKILSSEITDNMHHEFSLSGRPSGLYLIRVDSGRRSGSLRIVKQ